jgi:hypothetical protein
MQPKEQSRDAAAVRALRQKPKLCPDKFHLPASRNGFGRHSLLPLLKVSQSGRRLMLFCEHQIAVRTEHIVLVADSPMRVWLSQFRLVVPEEHLDFFFLHFLTGCVKAIKHFPRGIHPACPSSPSCLIYEGPANTTALETVTRHGPRAAAFVDAPSPVAGEGSSVVKHNNWMRGSLEPLTRPYLLNIQRCPLPQRAQ